MTGIFLYFAHVVDQPGLCYPTIVDDAIFRNYEHVDEFLGSYFYEMLDLLVLLVIVLPC